MEIEIMTKLDWVHLLAIALAASTVGFFASRAPRLSIAVPVSIAVAHLLLTIRRDVLK